MLSSVLENSWVESNKIVNGVSFKLRNKFLSHEANVDENDFPSISSVLFIAGALYCIYEKNKLYRTMVPFTGDVQRISSASIRGSTDFLAILGLFT